MSPQLEFSLRSIAIELAATESSAMSDPLGRAIHARIMAWLNDGNPEVARRVHDTAVSPLSIAPLRGRRSQGRVRSGDRFAIVVGILDETLIQPLLMGLMRSDRQPIVLGKTRFCLASANVLPGSHPAVKASSYTELRQAPALGRDIQLRFCSPTSFKQKQGIQTFPLPELVFDSLWRRWNEFAPESEKLPEADWTGWVAAYDLKTKALPMRKGVELGAVGWVRYRFPDAETQQVASTLARFAEFAGVGRKTAQGLGSTKLETQPDSSK
ncbi:CRISPR-associated endoribonuclease Cas6 [Baaleninema simplex]|uniref:CRISPR-associated endoribonuclease Cas6 n=1 Tax=Baaleninema simplex TaxID=2862350 RepID=UPI000346FC76|nr:CRISPR-associated endoribonuclease Cas6 [Baaleninema simplex]